VRSSIQRLWNSPVMTHPYSTIEFGESLRHIGEPIYIPEWGTTVLRRACGMGYTDAIGTYPITVFKPGCDLAAGLDRLSCLGLVSIVVVIEDVWRPELADLRRTFDVTRAFKRHYVYDRDVSTFPFSKNHRYKIQRAGRAVRVQQFNLATRLDDWDGLYQTLIGRHGLAGTMHAFPRRHHGALAKLPGITAIGAFAEGQLVSCHIWARHDGHAMSHLVASNESGYASRAAYALNAASIDLLADCRTLNFGGSAGADDDPEAGLARFKRGFANTAAPSYLCGKILAVDAYDELSRQADVSSDASYFPAYRRPIAREKRQNPLPAPGPQ
jgi:hypothetical protein